MSFHICARRPKFAAIAAIAYMFKFAYSIQCDDESVITAGYGHDVSLQCIGQDAAFMVLKCGNSESRSSIGRPSFGEYEVYKDGRTVTLQKNDINDGIHRAYHCFIGERCIRKIVVLAGSVINSIYERRHTNDIFSCSSKDFANVTSLSMYVNGDAVTPWYDQNGISVTYSTEIIKTAYCTTFLSCLDSNITGHRMYIDQNTDIYVSDTDILRSFIEYDTKYDISSENEAIVLNVNSELVCDNLRMDTIKINNVRSEGIHIFCDPNMFIYISRPFALNFSFNCVNNTVI
ncbi:b149.15 [miniopterid betaherpesvirus 1]|uniref:B149.15 n=1 Tax=miniopterid betaherpesvirus 1 TaxID=3070189 RepID=I3VQE7_9BETA|nr:b149.15 [miniopterid betaherpesvirus 1]AFK83991.1 b149.15 [miniopterid betaherpesvirus 1]